MKSPLKFCFVCICQQGELEIQALLLMASLKYYSRVDCELAVALPQPETVWGRPDKSTIRQLCEWGVKVFSVKNPISPSYPIGNKLGCLGIDVDVDRVIFLDSDMLCIRPFYFDPVFYHQLCARAASSPLKGESNRNWEYIYKCVELDAPLEKMRSAVTNELMYPYFNAGFISVDPMLNFSDIWIKYSKKVDALENVRHKRPYLDQIALPLAAMSLGKEFVALDNRYNFPPRLRNSSSVNSAILYHYNNPQVAKNYPRVVSVMRALVKKYPVISKKIKRDNQWKDLFKLK